MFIKILYFAIVFIAALVAISKGIEHSKFYNSNKISKVYTIMCIAFSVWGLLSIGATFLDVEFWVQISYLLSEFAKVVTLVASLELMCYLTGCLEDNNALLNKVSSAYLYSGAVLILIMTILGNGKLKMDGFGPYFLSPFHFYEIIKSVVYIFVLFGYFYIVTYYKEKCKKQRELHAYHQFLNVLIIAFAAMIIEVSGFCVFSKYIPSLILAFAFITIFMSRIMSYMSSIQLKESDFADVLSPRNLSRSFICDEEGNIVFRNRRLDVYVENFRDKFENKSIFEVYNINSQKFVEVCSNDGPGPINVRTLYLKNESSVILAFDNRYDMFGRILATIVTVYPEDEFIVSHADETFEEDRRSYVYGNNTIAEIVEAEENEKFEINASDRRELQIDSLIELMTNAHRLYYANERRQFEYNLKGIRKTSSMLSFSALDELTNRIEDACLFDDWGSIESMMNEMDRQLETIKAVRG